MSAEVQPLDLRPAGLGELLDRTVRVYRRRLGLFFGVALIIYSAKYVLKKLLELLLDLQGYLDRLHGLNRMLQADGMRLADLLDLKQELSTLLVVGATLLLIWSLAWQFSMGIYSVALDQRDQGDRLGLPGLFRRTLGHLVRLVGAYSLVLAILGLVLVCSLAAAFGLLQLYFRVLDPLALRALAWIPALLGTMGIVLGPLLFFYIHFLLVGPVIVLERASMAGSLVRSWRLMARRAGGPLWDSSVVRASVVLAVFSILSVAVSLLLYVPLAILGAIFFWDQVGGRAPFVDFLFALPPWLQISFELLALVLDAAVAPLGLVAVVGIYYDIRARHEGLDLELRLSRRLEAISSGGGSDPKDGM